MKENNVITDLNLRDNRIDPDQIGEALKYNQSLTVLNLAQNKITDISCLTEGLAVNLTLRRIDLSGNQIGKRGIVHLRWIYLINGSLNIAVENVHRYFLSLLYQKRRNLSTVNRSLQLRCVKDNEISANLIPHTIRKVFGLYHFPNLKIKQKER